MKRLVLLIGLMLVFAPRAEATTWNCTQIPQIPNHYKASGNIAPTGTDVVNFVGTGTSRCVVDMAGFSFVQTAGDTTFSGTFNIKFAELDHCGTDGVQYCMARNTDPWLYCNGCTWAIEDTNIHTSIGLFVNIASSAGSISFQRNHYWKDNTLSVAGDKSFSATQTPGALVITGSGTATCTIASNLFDESWLEITAPNCVIGKSTGPCSTLANLGNVIIGERAGIYVGSAWVGEAHCNISMGIEDTDAIGWFWGDVENLVCLGTGNVTYNMFYGGQWQATGTFCNNSFNLFIGGGGHNSIRTFNSSETNTRAHHNLYVSAAGLANGQGYGNPYVTGGGGEALFQINYSGDNPQFDHMTADVSGQQYLSLLWMNDPSGRVTIRSSVFSGLFLRSTICPGSTPATCSEAFGVDDVAGFNPTLPVRVTYLDYNLIKFDATSTRHVVYGVTATGKVACDPGMGQHDIGGCNTDGSAPLFRGPFPISCGRLCSAGGLDGGGLPFTTRDLRDRVYTIADIFNLYSWVYSPQAGSPLRGAADPADGSDDIGAFPYNSGSSAAVVTTNKPPRVMPGKQQLTTGARGILTSDQAQLVGSADDDGLPNGTLTCAWTQLNGPGTATIDHPDRCAATATALGPSGTYTFRLSATDGVYTSHADVQVIKP